jgi:DNA-binding NarL/FixJ family response regulator
VLDLARTRLVYGERLRRSGRRRDARPVLHAAHDAFSVAGATLWQARAAGELRAAGVRIASPEAGNAELTPQELAIATLVAQGKSNPEIAAAVFLSRKTVEYHLSNTYRKLNVHTRVELANLMADRL